MRLEVMETGEISVRPDFRSDAFQRHRGRLFGLAYRMLGSRADAEDVLQDAYLRWHGAAADDIRSVEGWLVTVVTRLCIDRLRAARVERESYVGPWLPEPIVGDGAAGADAHAELASSLSTAFLLVMERLAAEERAAFLLHDVFDTDYSDISRVLGKSEAACRQLVSRARRRVREHRLRSHVDPSAVRRLLDGFVRALQQQDRNALLRLFANEAAWTSDGGGKARAARKVIHGRDRIVRFVLGVLGRRKHRFAFHRVLVNEEPGLLLTRCGERFAALSVRTDGARIIEVFAVLNPDKLPVTTSAPERLHS